MSLFRLLAVAFLPAIISGGIAAIILGMMR